MSTLEEERKKKLFMRWNKLSKDLTKLIYDIDRDNARPILEEMGYTLLSYPNMDQFLIEYDTYLFNKQPKPGKNSLDKNEKEPQDNVVNIFDFKNKDVKKDE
jgi:hypothetical protein